MKIIEIDERLISDLRTLIETSKSNLAILVNSEMSLLYWYIGKRINLEVLQNERAEYGKQIIQSLSSQLVLRYGSSFSEKNLRRMMQFAVRFPNEEIVVSLIRQLSWTHIIALIPIENDLKRDFYIEMCKMDKWSVRTLRDRIDSMLFERTAISKKGEVTILHEIEQLKNEEKLSPDLVFRDPYFLDFLGLQGKFSEKDLETSILVEIQDFIIEIGADFAFLARQKRITIDNEDYYIDLLFYHRRLKCRPPPSDPSPANTKRTGQDGTYHCICCGARRCLTPRTKFDAGCGWPSFSARPVPGAIRRHHRPQPRHAAHRNRVCTMRGASGPCLPRRPGTDRPALLHELGVAGLHRPDDSLTRPHQGPNLWRHETADRLFPIILFFVAFKIWGIYVATGVAIAATVAQIGYLRLQAGKVEPMQWLSLGVIVLFGGATLHGAEARPSSNGSPPCCTG
jgi:predicted nuclease of restriction endonuclease-like (RecB) superfamily